MHEQIIFTCHTYKQDAAFNNPQGLICNKACGVMVIVVGNGHGDTSSNPGFAFHIALIPLGKILIQLLSL